MENLSLSIREKFFNHFQYDWIHNLYFSITNEMLVYRYPRIITVQFSNQKKLACILFWEQKISEGNKKPQNVIVCHIYYDIDFTKT